MGGTHKKHKEKHGKSKRHKSGSRTRSKENTSVELEASSPNTSSVSRYYREEESQFDKSDSNRPSQQDQIQQREERQTKDKNNRPEASNSLSLRDFKDSNRVERSGDVSLSIEETNKLREKLGLKPLESKSSVKDNKDVSYEDRSDVHAPASNISSSRDSDKLREKMQERKEKRRINKKLNDVRSLGGDDSDPAEDGAAAWVRKMRKQEEEKQLAKKRAKLLEEMEEEFGVTDVINSGMKEMVNQNKRKKYSAKDLAGLKIEHQSKEFMEGSSVIVTLKDQGILDDGEDILENINMTDDRKTIKNVESRKRKSDYRPYDELDEDTGMLKVKGILEKYDEEIEAKREQFITLDGMGNADDEDEKELQRIRKDLIAQQISLETMAPKLAMDYYTEEEMVKFKKPGKKRRKIRKRETIKADDLLPLVGELKNDHGSRKRPKGIMKDITARQSEHSELVPVNLTMEVSAIEEEREFLRKIKEVEHLPVEDDQAELELQMALERSRNSKIKKDNVKGSIFLNKVINQEVDGSQDDAKKKDKKKSKGAIVLDSTSEFCRALGEIPSIDGGIQEEKTAGDMMPEDDDLSVEATGGWEQVTESSKKENKVTQKYEAVLEEEPDLKVGVAAALKVASIKGFVEAKRKQLNNFPALNLPQTKAIIDEEKMRDEEKDRYHRGYERERYDPYAFKDKDSYKPDVKLEYVDEHGRPLTEKEAFRFLSHKFHGKGSGKMKTEKRAKKLTEEMKLKKMSAIDTPLNTSQMMAERQMLSQTPYVVLSGGGKNLLTTNLISKK